MTAVAMARRRGLRLLLPVVLALATSGGLLATQGASRPAAAHPAAPAQAGRASQLRRARIALASASPDPAARFSLMPSSPGTFIARRGQLRARFSAAGVDVGQGSPVLRLGLFGVGHGKALTPVAQVAPAVWESRVVYLHPGLSEWFANAPEGLEQGFLLTQRPDGSGPLTLLVGRVSDRSRRVASTESAITVDGLRYGDLTAIDARGRRLSTRLILSGRQLLLVVDDGHASYPLRIDPTTKLARRSRPR